MVLRLLPLLAVVGLLGILATAAVSRRVDRAVKRASYALFGGTAIRDGTRRERVLRSAGIGTPFRVYVTKTYLYTAVAAFAGSVVGVYLGAFVIDLLGLDLTAPRGFAGLFVAVPPPLRTFNVRLFAVLGVSSVLLGLLAAGGVYFVRWQIPAIRADTRRRQINAGMPRTVAFVYALSRGGMAFPDVMRSLSEHPGVFGASAEEVGVGVRQIDLFGVDLVSAIRDLSRRTPSEQFRTFSENLVSVLQSGRDLSSFMHDEYERYRQQAEDQQQEILELLATVAEVYVTVVVAGMLFTITILLVIGLTGGDTLVLVRLLTYVVLPATNLLFVAYLLDVTRPLRVTRERVPDETSGSEPADVALDVASSGRRTSGGGATDGGAAAAGEAAPARRGTDPGRTAANWARLRAYRRLRRLRGALTRPVESLVEEPTLLLLVTVPLAVVFLAAQVPPALDGGAVDLRTLDDAVVQATLFVLATFAVVHEVGQRRLRRLEEAVPDLLERLASLNEAGVSVVSSFERVRRSDVGALDEEIERVWRDIQWGATVEGALGRFERRVETPAVTRTVTLITSAMRASNEIGPVLRIAAEQARSDRRLKRRRRQEMFTYLVVIYVAFVVFLIVIGAIDAVLIPSLPGADAGATTAPVPGFLEIGEVDVEAYRLAFFHTALVQATLSGLVGGQMGGGSVKDGVKHATIMLAVTYGVFVVGF